MEEIHIRLRDELERLGLSMAEAARVIGEESSQGIRDVCSGRKRASAELVAKLSVAGVDALYILTGQRSAQHTASSAVAAMNPSKSAAAYQPPLSSAECAPEGFILVPHYEVQASAGNGTLVHSEQIVDYLAFKSDWVRNTLGVAQKDLALISVKGDSMEPGLSNDDLILVDMRKNSVEDNAIYVLQLDGTLIVKRIQRKLDGALHVMSDNPRYENEIVGADRAADLNVLGRVVWSGRRM